MKRMYVKTPDGQIKRAFEAAIKALDQYDLTDIMHGLAEFHHSCDGGTTPLYEAVEEATEEME